MRICCRMFGAKNHEILSICQRACIGFKSWPDSLTFHTIMEANLLRTARSDQCSKGRQDRVIQASQRLDGQ